jgi:putative SOS response-associated peptidase YedK
MVVSYCPLLDRGLLRQRYGVTAEFSSQWPEEVAPELPAPVIVRSGEAGCQLISARLGLLPHWVRDPTVVRKTFNARLETVQERAIFKDTWQRGQRCVAPALGFHLPHTQTGQRWWMTSGGLLHLAGLWARGWSPNGEALMTFTLLTLPDPQHADAPRLPALVPEQSLQAWLNAPPEEAASLLLPPTMDDTWQQLPQAVPERHAATRIKNTPKDLPFRSRALPP